MKDIGLIFLGNDGNFKVNVTFDGDFLSKEFGDDEASADAFYQKCLELKEEWDDTLYQDVMKELLGIKISEEFNGLIEVDHNTGEVFLKGTKVPMPNLLAETFLKYLKNDYPVKPLVNFWILLMGNPDAQVREDLFKFLSTYDFSITENGNFAAYKTVLTYNTLEGNEDYQNLKQLAERVKGWKKSLNSMMAYRLTDEDENVSIEMTKAGRYKKWEVEGRKSIEKIGLLGDAIEELEKSKEIKYVAKHSYSRDIENGVFIELGKPHNMDRHECDNDQYKECSKGLHVGSADYVQSFGGYSNPVLLCYVNPMNVVAVPKYDNSKMRVSEYFPVCELERVNENGRETFKRIENEFLEDSYLPYTQSQLDDIVTKFENDAESLRGLTNDQINSAYMDVLRNRVQNIKTTVS